MGRPTSAPTSIPTNQDDVFAELNPEVARAYPRNFTATVLYSIFMRVGWIYKTESAIIPGFVTSLTSHPLLISLTPLISRLSQFLPQFLFLGIVERAPRKKPLFLLLTGLFTLAWGLLATILWFGRGSSRSVLLALFFLLYGGSWTCMGVERTINRVMQGRLIPTRRRGRIFAVGGPIGSYSVVVSGPLIAYLLSQGGDFPRNYAVVFGLGFLFFLGAVASVTLLREPSGLPVDFEGTRLHELARDGWRLLREDGDFRGIFYLACIQQLSSYLFTYYVAYARTWSSEPGFHQSLSGMLGWGLSVQNLVIGTLSLFLGLLVDWKGNRVVLRGLCLMLSNVPLLAVVLGRMVPLDSRLAALLGVYALIGGLPVLYRVINNYVLEISAHERQALYVGIFGSGQIITLLFPLCLGVSIDLLRRPLGEKAAYELVFLFCAAVLYASVVFAWRLHEPRHFAKPEANTVSSPLAGEGKGEG